MFKGKSLMTGAQNTNKSLINPVSTSSQQELQFGTELTNTLQRIETYYVGKMPPRKYLEIPESVPAFLSLNDVMLSAISKQKNTNLRLLFQIARDGMDGALHCRGHTIENTDLNLRVIMLNKKNDDILSGKNEVKAMGDTCGQFAITKTFKLAPIYSYYIQLYGMPAYGVGFDATKLSLLSTIMQRYGVDPFKSKSK
jgi:hypothetical protein